MGNPITIKEMFDMTQNIKSKLNDEKHFTELGDNIIGVPIKFGLIPISMFLQNYNAEKLYVQLEDSILNKFLNMMREITDFNHYNCILGRIYDNCNPDTDNPGVAKIIFNNKSILCSKIRNYEAKVIKFTDGYLQESVSLFKDYKSGKSCPEKLLELVNKFQNDPNKPKVDTDIENFKNECLEELYGIDFDDIQGDDYSLFVDKTSLENWYLPNRDAKILFKSKGKKKLCELIFS
jgi:hypothetical protein